jgi:hypothetical protein
MTGFEPAASSSRTKRATGLRYIPKNIKISWNEASAYAGLHPESCKLIASLKKAIIKNHQLQIKKDHRF